jgi:hypothetical protein
MLKPLVLSIVFLMLAACSGLQQNQQGTLTVEALKNAQYENRWAYSGRVALVDGIYREKFLPGSSTEIVVRLSDQIALGDLNGDHLEDGAVVLISNPGTSGTYYDLAVVVNLKGYGFNVASESLGEGIQVKAVTIVSEVIKVEMMVHGPHDPNCCPTLPITKTYRLQGNELVTAN